MSGSGGCRRAFGFVFFFEKGGGLVADPGQSGPSPQVSEAAYREARRRTGVRHRKPPTSRATTRSAPITSRIRSRRIRTGYGDISATVAPP